MNEATTRAGRVGPDIRTALREKDDTKLERFGDTLTGGVGKKHLRSCLRAWHDEAYEANHQRHLEALFMAHERQTAMSFGLYQYGLRLRLTHVIISRRSLPAQRCPVNKKKPCAAWWFSVPGAKVR